MNADAIRIGVKASGEFHRRGHDRKQISNAQRTTLHTGQQSSRFSAVDRQCCQRPRARRSSGRAVSKALKLPDTLYFDAAPALLACHETAYYALKYRAIFIKLLGAGCGLGAVAVRLRTMMDARWSGGVPSLKVIVNLRVTRDQACPM